MHNSIPQVAKVSLNNEFEDTSIISRERESMKRYDRISPRETDNIKQAHRSSHLEKNRCVVCVLGAR